MSDALKQYYWDTCVFIAFLNDERDDHGAVIDDIGQFLGDARDGKCVIHCSTLTIAEITRTSFQGDSKSFEAFQKLWGGGLIPMSPDPNTMRLASELRSLEYAKTGGFRKLHTPDAVHLASALTLEEAFGVKLDAFHTFDKGGRRDPVDGKGVPLLGYEDWCERCSDDPLAKRVIDLPRMPPHHPERTLV